MLLSDLELDSNDLERVLEQISSMGGVEIGYGSNASVHALPFLTDMVLRASNGVDGFATYAELSRGPLSPFVGRQVPVIHDLAVSEDGGMLLAVVERLEKVDDATEKTSWFESARRLAAGQAIASDALADLECAQPGFGAFIVALRDASGRRVFDSRAENFMLRGTELIFVDPIGTCLLFDEIQRMRAQLQEHPWSERTFSPSFLP